MGKDKVVIFVVATIVGSAILFGILMAYRTYTLPLAVDDIESTISMLKGNLDDDDGFIMERLATYNYLARSYKMRNKTTGEIRKFTREEMKEIYNIIEEKEAVIKYLKSIDNEKQKREELEYACYTLKIITSEELSEIWEQ